MKNINIIQVVLIGVSIVAIIAAVIMFSLFTGRSDGTSSYGDVTLWGTVPESDFNTALQTLEGEEKKIEGLTYVEKDPLTFENDLLTAIAENRGPDLVLLNEKQIISSQKRMQTIPFVSFPLRDYEDAFIDESSLLVTDEGLLGVPFLVDPLIMYYNKDILNNAGFSKPPETWTEVLSLAPTLTSKDSSFNISKSTIALGAFDNITNAKDIFWTLVLQAGNPVIKRDRDSQTNEIVYVSLFDDNLNFTLNPAYAASNFFTQFANPTKTIYSWNRSLPTSQTAFISGDLAFYIGYASELETIKRLNPNLNFDISVVPQSLSSTRKVTYGSMHTLAVPLSSPNLTGAVNVIGSLTSPGAQMVFANQFRIPSVLKELLATSNVSNRYESVFNRSAIMAQGILEPNIAGTDALVKELIDTIVSGQYEISEAIERANEKLVLLLANE